MSPPDHGHDGFLIEQHQLTASSSTSVPASSCLIGTFPRGRPGSSFLINEAGRLALR